MTVEQAALAGIAGLVLVGLVAAVVRGRRASETDRPVAPARLGRPLDEDPIVAAIARRTDEERR